jgi:hypothetical protein
MLAFVACVQKGAGYHLDILVVGLMTGLCSVLELPKCVVIAPQDALECRLLLLACRKGLISPEHAGGGPHDWPVICDGAAPDSKDAFECCLLLLACRKGPDITPGHAGGRPDY